MIPGEVCCSTGVLWQQRLGSSLSCKNQHEDLTEDMLAAKYKLYGCGKHREGKKMGEKLPLPSAGSLFLPLPQLMREQTSTFPTLMISSETDPQRGEKGKHIKWRKWKINYEQKQSLRHFPLLWNDKMPTKAGRQYIDIRLIFFPLLKFLYIQVGPCMFTFKKISCSLIVLW